MSDIPVIESDVYYLELSPVPAHEEEVMDGYLIEAIDSPDINEYLDLYREIGRNYIWNYRPSQSSEEIQSILSSNKTKLYYLKDKASIIGMAECDMSDLNNIEIVHFGLIPTAINKGLGKAFFKQILFLLSKDSPTRIFLSTCGLDHPKASQFYQNAGFKIFKTSTAKFKDYRYSDFYSIDDAPQIPHGVERYP